MIATMEVLFSKSETGLSPPEPDKNIPLCVIMRYFSHRQVQGWTPKPVAVPISDGLHATQ